MGSKVLIAGEHFPLLTGLEVLSKSVLGSDCKIEFINNFLSLIKKIECQNIDLVITDIIMEGLDSFSMLEQAIKIKNDIKILIVSCKPSEIFAHRYLDAGALGYICTTESGEEFKKAIRSVYLGKKYIPKNLRQGNQADTFNEKISQNPFNQLSKQEFSVLLLLLQGKGVKEVSRLLNLKITTISTYRLRIFKKLKVQNFMALAALAMHFKIMTINPNLND